MSDPTPFVIRPAIGQPITFTAFLKRKNFLYPATISPPLHPEWLTTNFRHPAWNNRGGYKWRVWAREVFSETQSGHFIGYRTYFDGVSEWIDDEVGYAFNPMRSFEIWLIVRSARHNPVPVLPADILQEAPSV
jgi:hypothetical protein